MKLPEKRVSPHEEVTMPQVKGKDDSMNVEELIEVRTAWDKIAEGYDKTNTFTQMRLGNESLLRAGLRRGMRFLDVASGSGALSIPAARIGADVTAIDLSPVMIELLTKRARNEGLDVKAFTMDGHNLQFLANSFDIAGSQFGVMLFPDMPRGIHEMVRVTKPGGCVLLNAYGNPNKIDFLSFIVRAVQSVRPAFDGPPADPLPPEFQLADPGRLKSEFRAAGLINVEVETVTESTEFESGKSLWEWIIWSNPIVEHIFGMLNITEEEKITIRSTLDSIVAERRGSGKSAVLTNPVNVGIGTK